MPKTRKKSPRSRVERVVEYIAPPQPPQSKTPTLLVILLIVISFFTGYLFFKVRSLEQTTGLGGVPPPLRQAPVSPTELKIKKPETSEHWRGDKNVRYVWVEYSDLECPFCKKVHPDMQKLLQEYKGRIAWVYRHFPLGFHQNAQKEGEATECAAELGGNDAFWKYTDMLFERTTSNGTGFALDKLVPLAGELGLNQTAFKQCLDSGKYEKKVKDDVQEGSRAGVGATPTGVIFDLQTGKTQVVEGAVPYEQLKQAVDDFLTKNK
ncbi:DsbA family protein [Candidatus Roizmanbacteria bacterium]|nr:DsbA family protein [Candidatus Roizmanbacteria bacterium]